VYTGDEIVFSFPTSDWFTETSGKPKRGTDAGTYTYQLKLVDEENTKWSADGYNGVYHVYITNAIKEHTNEAGEVDVIMTSDKGIRDDYILVVVEKSDVTDLKEKYKFDGEAKFSYDVKLMKDGQTVQPDGPVTIALLIPAELAGKTFSIYHIHNEKATLVAHSVDGDYAIVTVDSLSDFVFVAPASEDDDSKTYLFIVGGVIAAMVLLIVAVCLVMKRKHSKP